MPQKPAPPESRAPHVQAALARASHVRAPLAVAQAKTPERASPERSPAPHVKAALAAVQLKRLAPSAASAPHLQAAVAATRSRAPAGALPPAAARLQAVQARTPPPSPATGRPVALHVQAALRPARGLTRERRKAPAAAGSIQRAEDRLSSEVGKATELPPNLVGLIAEYATPKVNAGGKQYENDMLKGGPATVAVSVDTFYDLWSSAQRDNNIHEPAVQAYMELIDQEAGIDAPFVDSIDFGEDGISIRTSEGRHRITAAKRKGLAVIHILRPGELAIQYTEIAGVKDALFPQGT